jgi:hypothetical protein
MNTDDYLFMPRSSSLSTPSIIQTERPASAQTASTRRQQA